MATMAGPTNMSKTQMGEYLDELRNHRPSRPSLNGTRSPPLSTRRRSWRNSMHSITSPSFDESSYKPSATSRSSSRTSFNENRDSSRSRVASAENFDRYGRRERADISRDKEESRRVSRALEQLDSQDEEAVMAAAKAEADELIWRYNNGGAPYKPSDNVPEKSEIPNEQFKKPLPRRSLDLLRKLSFSKESPRSERPPSSSSATDQELKPRRSLRRLSQKLSFSRTSRRRSSNGKRNISGETQTEPFPNEKQRIFEDGPEDIGDIVSAYAEEESERQPLHVRRNPFARARQSVSMSPDKAKSRKTFRERSNLQENLPSQSRTQPHISNEGRALHANQTGGVSESDVDIYEPVEYRDGKELRSDDIRAATSMRKKDRSTRLPAPSAVSDKPQRPIVSFDPDWKPPEISNNQNQVSLSMDPTDDSSHVILIKESEAKDIPTEPQTDERRAHMPNTKTYPLRGGNQTYYSRQHDVKSTQAPTNDLNNQHRAGNRPGGATSRNPCSATDANVNGVATREQAAADKAARQPGHQTRVSQARRTNSARRPIEADFNSGAIKTPTVPLISCTPAADDDQSEAKVHYRQQVLTQSPIPTISCTPADDNETPINSQSHRARRPGIHDRTMSKPHWTPGARDRSALCSQCALPIAGRSVSAAGARFHPECFTCHHCREALECVAFYPEPAEHRAARVERNELRAMGEGVEQPEGTSEADDADDSLRFFCHLDFHEFFSPRCKTCKTPIEGQVIVACGAEYHPGHFFCAQCGDPFDPSTPFVEKDGYAWCVNCHTNRYAASCRKCRRPITKMVLNALGTEWHEECFRCMECDGKFTDGRYFLRGDSKAPVCFACEERRLKS